MDRREKCRKVKIDLMIGMAIMMYLIKLPLLAAVIATVIAVSASATNPRPHIIILLADDLGYGDVSYHSSVSESVIKTPNIDDLAKNGVTLENYYVQPICTPTRSQLLTGRYQIHTGLMHGVIQPPQPSCIPLNETLLPEILKEYGYSTHIVGKWHLGMYKPACLPTERGFDSHFGILLGSGKRYSHTSSHYLKHVRMEGKDFRFTAGGVDDDKVQETYDGVYATTAYVERVNEIIDGTAESSSPLFLYVAFQNVHKPIEVPRRYAVLYKRGPLSGSRKRYAGMVSALDDAVGEIVSKLKTAGLYNDSVIIFSTDNGGVHQPGNNWPLRGAKHTLWEGGIRAVGFVHSPAYIPSCNVGKISQDLIHVSDWLPSLAEGLLKETLPEPSNSRMALDGINVWDYFAECDVEEPLRKELLHNIDPLYLVKRVKKNQYSDDGILQVSETFDTSIHAALRVGDMKLLTGKQGSLLRKPPPESSSETPTETVNEDQSVWLFNITADPYELNDLSTEEPEIVNEMVAKLADYWESDKRANVIYPQYELEADPGVRGYWGPWRHNNESLI